MGDDVEVKDDKPFDDEPFDAEVEADEDSEPKKYIQQLSGKLGQTLRQYTKDTGKPDLDLEKFAINSVISATHTSEMDDSDQKDIIKKIKTAGNEEEGHEEELEMDKEIDAEIDSGDEEMDDFVGGEEPMEEAEEDMFMQNIVSMKSDAEKILSMDKDTIKKRLKGHDWAKDHISTSTDDADEVSNFLSNGDVSESLFKTLIENLITDQIIDEGYNNTITEVEYRGRKVKLNSPMKNSGGKPYKVYVKNKKGNVVKITFGSGMRSKLSDKKAKERYNKRHGCSKGRHNDKTKAGYWSCRLPRYAKKLGLSGGGTWW